MIKPYHENIRFLTKTDYVVETIRTAILTGEITPGARITEQEMRDSVKVSSSPVREAFNQLEAVKKRDAVKAGSLMRKHLESSMEALYRDKKALHRDKK